MFRYSSSHPINQTLKQAQINLQSVPAKKTLPILTPHFGESPKHGEELLTTPLNIRNTYYRCPRLSATCITINLEKLIRPSGVLISSRRTL